MPVTEVTRRAIFDALTAGHHNWAGRLREDDFLSRLYDLTSLPSDDYRFNTAAGDILQHRVSWHDWDDDWAFYDRRFNLLHGPDENFLSFLCETVHPTVRDDTDDAWRMVELYNGHLRRDDWELYERSQMK